MRAQFVDIAARRFATEGFQATSLDDIAGEAGYSKAAVLYHFGTKDDLLVAVIGKHIDETTDLVSSLEELDGASICVTSGTTTELNLADQMAFLGVEYNPVVAAEIDTVYGQYEEGRCDAVTSDKSQLLGRRSSFADPEAHVILDVTMSKEPLAPVVASGDNQWADVVRWVVYSTIEAEEQGIDSMNIGEFAGGDNPVVARLLGETGELGSALGLPDDFVVQAISAVGNYGEIYDRAFGPETALALNREGTVNDLWTNGGLMYAPPFR